MGKQSNFLPQRVSGALKSIAKRTVGAILLAIALWALFALAFYDPYLDGFAVASTFGDQSSMGQLVGFIRYGIGVVPTLFLVLCVARWGLSWVAAWNENSSPEYNFLRCIVAVFIGAAGLGMIMPSGAFGGMIGYIAASDVWGLIGRWGVAIGAVCIAVFLLLAAKLLHIRWAHIKGGGARCVARSTLVNVGISLGTGRSLC